MAVDRVALRAWLEASDAPAGGGPQHPSLIASSWEEFGWDLLRVALRRFRG
jgi:hypothetical protein